MITMSGFRCNDELYDSLKNSEAKLFSKALDVYNSAILNIGDGLESVGSLECTDERIQIAIASAYMNWANNCDGDLSSFKIYYPRNKDVYTFLYNALSAETENDDINLDSLLEPSTDLVFCIKENFKCLSDDQLDDQTVRCPNKIKGVICNTPIPSSLFTSREYIDTNPHNFMFVASCPKCGAFVRQDGQLSTSRSTNCPFCGDAIPLNPTDNGNICPKCKERLNAGNLIKTAFESLDSVLNDINTQALPLLKKKVDTCVDILFNTYKYYYTSLDDIEGVVATVMSKDKSVSSLMSVRVQEEKTPNGTSLSYKLNNNRNAESEMKGVFLELLTAAMSPDTVNSMAEYYDRDYLDLVNYMSAFNINRISGCSRIAYHLDGSGFAQTLSNKQIPEEQRLKYNKVLAGFHAPHVFGYFYTENGYKTIAGNEKEFKIALTETITRDMFEFISNLNPESNDLKGMYFAICSDEQFKTFDKYESYISHRDKYRKLFTQAALKPQVIRGVYKNLYTAVDRYLKHLMTFIVTTRCGAGMFGYDIISDQVSMSETLRRGISTFNDKFYTYMKTSSSSSVRNTSAAEDYSKVYDNMSSSDLVSSNVYSTIFITSIKKFTGLPQFAYVPMSKLKALGNKFNSDNILLGRTLDGNPYYMRGLFGQELFGVDSLIGGSRSGKGVTTLAMLGSLLNDITENGATKYVMGYADCKPETFLSLFKIECKINETLIAAGRANECVHFLALDTRSPYPGTGEGASAYARCKTIDDNNPNNHIKYVEVLKKRQKNWLFAQTDEMKQIWEDYFGVDILGSLGKDNRDRLFTYLIYSKIIQLFEMLSYHIQNISKFSQTETDVRKFVLFADEINQVNACMCGVKKAILTPIYTLYNGELKRLKGDAKVELEEKKRRWGKFVNLFYPPLPPAQGSNFGEGIPLFLDKIESHSQLKTGGSCTTVLIGQNLSELITGKGGISIPAWIPYCAQKATMNATIFGNWSLGEDKAECNKFMFTPLSTRPEYVNNYIHGADDKAHNTSGFFAVNIKGNLSVVQTYLVLDDNTPQQTDEGSSCVRSRVAAAYDDPTEREEALDALNQLLFKHVDIIPDAKTNSINKVNGKEIPPEFVKNEHGNVVSNRVKEVGFEGYLQYIGDNLNFDDVNSLATFARAFGSSYNYIWGIFRELGFVKKLGYSCLEDYIYDMRPFTFFYTDEDFTTTNVTAFDCLSEFISESNSAYSNNFDDKESILNDYNDFMDLPSEVQESVIMTFGYPCINNAEVSFMGKVESYHETISRIANKAKNCDTATKAEMLKQTRSIMPAVSKLFNEANPAVTDNCKDYAFRTIKGIIQHLIGVVQS